jgi:cell division protein FtsI/penicillin-binding protein 2
LSSPDEKPNSIGRRRFIKSLFGLTAGISEGETPSEAAKPSPGTGSASAKTSGACFLWADLKTGFVGFPTGLRVPKGPPGSVMKLVAATAIMETGALDPNNKVDCKGHATIDGETFHCQFPHGHVDLTHAIAMSCNSYFVNASKHISSQAFLHFAERLGLKDSVARMPVGIFPAATHDPSYTFILGLNETFQPSALQLLRLAALVGSKGDLPFLRRSDDMETPDPPFRVQLHEATWHRLQQGMEMAVRDGTAKHLDPENKMHIAAKTGTSIHGKKFQSCIIGYFPYDKPGNAFCIWSPTGTSQESAVPQAHQFLFSTTWP